MFLDAHASWVSFVHGEFKWNRINFLLSLNWTLLCFNAGQELYIGDEVKTKLFKKKRKADSDTSFQEKVDK